MKLFVLLKQLRNVWIAEDPYLGWQRLVFLWRIAIKKALKGW